MLLRIDTSTIGPTQIDQIRKYDLELETNFISTFKNGEIEGQDKFIIICRGFYVNKLKSLNYVAELLETLHLKRVLFGVYITDQTSLLKKTLDSAERAEIFDQRKDLLASVNLCLNK
ncbi:unnamed protein product [Adineta steineri]|uniref:Uncharacterized protein n=1 Tax=Adineta steineri TaxID=433720 RepID=A0A814DHR6_9BILA|nr:unnamed protein product [Adineta steineri]CAF3585392.1 unnamed protein product [Adineta steineri]